MSWPFQPREATATRMTPDEVLAVARATAADDPFFARALANPVARRTERGVVWTVGSMTMDLGLEIDVDDGTGEVLARRMVNGRGA